MITIIPEKTMPNGPTEYFVYHNGNFIKYISQSEYDTLIKLIGRCSKI